MACTELVRVRKVYPDFRACWNVSLSAVLERHGMNPCGIFQTILPDDVCADDPIGGLKLRSIGTVNLGDALLWHIIGSARQPGQRSDSPIAENIGWSSSIPRA
jgi:hypothetical protein